MHLTSILTITTSICLRKMTTYNSLKTMFKTWFNSCFTMLKTWFNSFFTVLKKWFGNSWFRLRLDEDRENRSETRNSLLVVSTLIAAVTFQAGVNPPGGVWQEDKDGHKAGSAIYADQKAPFYVFLIFNTIALSTSTQLLMSLTWRFPYQLEVWLSTVSMLVTYSASVFAIAPHESVKYRYLLLSALLPLGLRFFIKIFKLYFQRDKLADGGDRSG